MATVDHIVARLKDLGFQFRVSSFDPMVHIAVYDGSKVSLLAWHDPTLPLHDRDEYCLCASFISMDEFDSAEKAIVHALNVWRDNYDGKAKLPDKAVKLIN